MNYLDMGFNSFLQRIGLRPREQMSSLDARQNNPSGSISAQSIIPPMNATTDITFSSTDNDTAEWTSGTIYFANGTNSGTMDAGNTGDIAATTYVYYDREELGALQTTTDVEKASGISKMLIAIVESGAAGKDCKITPTIAAGLTVTNITASSLNVDELSAITANLGDVTVGGSANGDGTISVKDSSDVEKVLINSDGVAVTGGKISVENTDGDTVFDSSGLVSTTSFITDQVGSYDTSTSSTSSTSYLDVPNMTLSAFNLTRTTGILVLVTMVLESFGGGAGSEAVIHVGGEVNDTQQVRIRVPPDNVKSTFTTYLLRQLPVTGAPHVSYTIKMQWKVATTGSLEVQQRQISYMLLGT